MSAAVRGRSVASPLMYVEFLDKEFSIKGRQWHETVVCVGGCVVSVYQWFSPVTMSVTSLSAFSY